MEKTAGTTGLWALVRSDPDSYWEKALVKLSFDLPFLANTFTKGT